MICVGRLNRFPLLNGDFHAAGFSGLIGCEDGLAVDRHTVYRQCHFPLFTATQVVNRDLIFVSAEQTAYLHILHGGGQAGINHQAV